MLPMCAAIWSCPNDAAMAFPVKTLVRFWVNHHLLEIVGRRPLWRVDGEATDTAQKNAR